MDEKIAKIEKIAKEIEGEKNFDKALAKFTEAAELIKVLLKDGEKQKGKVMEIVREIDEMIEQEMEE